MRPRNLPVRRAAPEPAQRQGKSVIVSLSPEAERLMAPKSAPAGQAAGNGEVMMASDSYNRTAETGAGRREAPFAHRTETVVYRAPGGLVDRQI